MRITADGQYPLTNSSQSVFVSGTMGTAIAKMVYLDQDGNYVDLENGNLQVNKQYNLTSGSMQISVDVSGVTTGTELFIQVA